MLGLSLLETSGIMVEITLPGQVILDMGLGVRTKHATTTDLCGQSILPRLSKAPSTMSKTENAPNGNYSMGVWCFVEGSRRKG